MKTYLLIFLFSINLIAKDEINVNFKELDLMEFINITSKTIKKDILVPFNIKGKVNFSSNKSISDNELLELLRTSLAQKGYFLIKKNGIFKVLKKSKRNFSKNKIKNNNKIFERKISIINLIHINGENLQKILVKVVGKNLDLKGEKPIIVYEKDTNSLIINANEAVSKQLKNIIKSLDKQKTQIYVKAKIIELDEYLLKNVGLKFGILGAKSYNTSLYTFSSNLNNGKAITFDTSSIGLKIPNLYSSLALGASLNLLKQSYALNVVSEPSLLCLNNKQSSIYVGETISIQTGSTLSTGGNTTNIFQRQDVGLTLKLKPRIFQQKVLIDIDTTIEGVKNMENTNNNPNTSKKYIKTSALVNNGESVILGGLIENKIQKNIEEIPYASDIPMIGELFKNKYKDNRTKNLIIIVTPYIIPKSKDLTYLNKELAKLKNLEDKYLENFLLNMKKNKKIEMKKESKEKNLAEKRLEEYFKF